MVMLNDVLLVALSCLFGLNLSGNELLNAAIIDGGDSQFAKPGQFPWMVVIEDTTCSGSILNERTIVTAAHCVFEYDHPLSVTVGSILDNNMDTVTSQKLDVDKIIIHPKYDNEKSDIQEYDVALLKLKTAITFDAFVQKVDYTCDKVMPGTQITFMGFGGGENGELGKLRYGTNKIVPCDFFTKMICTNVMNGQTRTSPGDSGGPLLIKESDDVFKQAGTVSGEDLKRQGIFTDFSLSCDFLKEFL